MVKVVLKNTVEETETGAEVPFGIDTGIYRERQLIEAYGETPDLIVGALQLLSLVVVMGLIFGFNIIIIWAIPALFLLASLIAVWYGVSIFDLEGWGWCTAIFRSCCRLFIQYVPVMCSTFLLSKHTYFIWDMLKNPNRKITFFDLYLRDDVVIEYPLAWRNLDIFLVGLNLITSVIFRMYYRRNRDVNIQEHENSCLFSLVDTVGFSIYLIILLSLTSDAAILYHRFLSTLPLVFFASRCVRVLLRCIVEMDQLRIICMEKDSESEPKPKPKSEPESEPKPKPKPEPESKSAATSRYARRFSFVTHVFALVSTLCFILFHKMNEFWLLIGLVAVSMVEVIVFTAINIRLIREFINPLVETKEEATV